MILHFSVFEFIQSYNSHGTDIAVLSSTEMVAYLIEKCKTT